VFDSLLIESFSHFPDHCSALMPGGDSERERCVLCFKYGLSDCDRSFDSLDVEIRQAVAGQGPTHVRYVPLKIVQRIAFVARWAPKERQPANCHHNGD
jgi:hypothetical protein